MEQPNIDFQIELFMKIRPFSEAEKARGGETAWFNYDENLKTLHLHNEGKAFPNVNTLTGEELLEAKKQIFSATFDKVLTPTSTQEEMFSTVGKPAVDNFLKGYNTSIITYGPTTAGKTFTAIGVLDLPEYQGLFPRSCKAIFDKAQPNDSFKLSILEVYLGNFETVRDFLSFSEDNKKVEIGPTVEGGPYFQNLNEALVTQVDDVIELIKRANEVKQGEARKYGKRIERQAVCYVLTKETTDLETNQKKRTVFGVYDLMGAERVRNDGIHMEENPLENVNSDNRSLIALQVVLKTLVDGTIDYIPYGLSKFTLMLRYNTSDPCRVYLIGIGSPSTLRYEPTLLTCKFLDKLQQMITSKKLNE